MLRFVGNLLRRLIGAFKIAGIDRMKFFLGQTLGERLGLSQAERMQFDVCCPLDPLFKVPGGLSVSNDNKLCHEYKK